MACGVKREAELQFDSFHPCLAGEIRGEIIPFDHEQDGCTNRRFR